MEMVTKGGPIPLNSPMNPSLLTVSLKHCVMEGKWCVCIRALMLSNGNPTIVLLVPAAADAIRVAIGVCAWSTVEDVNGVGNEEIEEAAVVAVVEGMVV